MPEIPMQNQDVIVLGAGIVGVSAALHLQARGRSVCLVDKGEPGQGTSFGNAGLIERSSVIPYSFPQGFSKLLRYATNLRTDVRYSPLYVPRMARWLFRYWRESSPERLEIATQAMLPLVEASVHEHDALVADAGCEKLIYPICSVSILPMTFWMPVPCAHAKLHWEKSQAVFIGSTRKPWSIRLGLCRLMPTCFFGAVANLRMARLQR
jgi:hypothetical protein